MSTQDAHATLAARLREEFDQTFRLPPVAAAAPTRHLLGIRAGGESYALDLADIAGLHLDRRIAPVSGSVPEWLGMAGIRGTLVSVYSLAMLMGHDRPSAAQTRWLALCGRNRSIGLAFEAFEHHFSLDPGRITPAASGERNAGHVSAIADTGEEKRLIIHVGAILTTVSRLCAAVTAPREK